MDEKDEFFQKESYKNVLIEFMTDFNSSKYLCQAFGGKLLVPKSDQELKEVNSFIHQSEKCSEAFLGLKKFNETMAVDLSGKVASFVRWGEDQPNGEIYQQCICLWDSSFDDCDCIQCLAGGPTRGRIQEGKGVLRRKLLILFLARRHRSA